MRRAPLALTAALSLVLVSACGSGDETAPDSDSLPSATATNPSSSGEAVAGVTDGADVTATLRDAEGAPVGTVGLTTVDGGTEVAVEVSGLAPGFLGFHVHETGLCEPGSASPDNPTTTGDFMSAGGHLSSDDEDHAGHTGDLPSLHVSEAGEARMTVITDAFTVEELGAGDGSAVMVHSGPDNFANVPERYAPDGPDEETLTTGDSGDRIACGVVE